MIKKRINKILWYGNDVPIAASVGGNGLDGLNEGEIYIKNTDSGYGIYILTSGRSVVNISGGDGLNISELKKYLTDNKYLRSGFAEIEDISGLSGYLDNKLDKAVWDSVFEIEKDNTGAITAIRAKYGFYSDGFVSAKGKSTGGSGGGGGATTLGGLVNVGSWADELPSYDRVMVQLSGATHWTSKPLSEVVGLDTSALAEYLTGNDYAKKSDIPSLNGYATVSWVEERGYLIATNADKAHWDAAYDSSHTHGNKSVLDGITQALINKWNSTDSVLNDLFEKVNIGTTSSPVYAIRAKYGLYSDGFISAKGSGTSGSSGSSTTLGGLANVGSWADGIPSADRIMVQRGGSTHWSSASLSEVVGLDTSALGDYLTSNGYAKETWVNTQLSGYATVSSLQSVSDKLNSFLEGTDTDNVINKWKELEAFLAGYTETNTLAELLGVKANSSVSITAGAGLSGGGNLTANRTISLLPATATTLGGVKVGSKLSIDANGVLSSTYTYTLPAASDTVLGGVKVGTTMGIASGVLNIKPVGTSGTYFKVTTNAYGQITSGSNPTTLAGFGIADGANALTVAGSGNAVTTATLSGHTITLTKGETFITKATFDDLFEKVNVGTTSSPVYAIRAKYGFYSDGFISAKGSQASSGGGGGLIQSVYGYASIGGAFSDTSLTDTFNAYTINKLAERITTIENGAITSVDWSIISNKPSWIGGTKPTYSFSEITSKPSTLSGYGITDAKIAGGVITLGSNTITPLTSHQSLANYVLTTDGRLSNSRPASDVYSWAKSYSLSTAINTLTVGDATPTDADYYIAQYAAGGTTTVTYHRRLHSALFTYIKSKLPAWATAASKPSYGYSEISGTPASLKSPYSLTIQANGTSLGTYDGSAAKTFNLTYSNVGAAAAIHTHTIANVTGLQTALDSKLNSSAYTASDILSKLKTVDGSGSGLDADTLDGYHDYWGNHNWSASVEKAFNSQRVLDLSSFDSNKWFPCWIGTSANGGTPTRIVFFNGLRGNKPSWATHASGFSLLIDVTCWGSGWGTIPSYAELFHYCAEYGGNTAFGGVEQNTMASTWLFWLRGGGIYYYWTSSDANFNSSTSGYSWTSGTYSYAATPRTTQGNPYSGMEINAYLSDNTASATKLQTARSIWGQSFDGTGNVSGALSGATTITASGTITSTGGVLVSKLSGITSAFGAQNTSWCHFQTTAPRFHFDKGISAMGSIEPCGAAYSLGTAANPFGSTFTNDWFRTIGATGWYSETYAGGICMTDSRYVRVYNNKAMKVDNAENFAFNSSGGYYSDWDTSAGNTWANALAYNLHVFNMPNKVVATNTYQRILGWSNQISGQGYMTRYSIGSARTSAAFGMMTFCIGNNDAATSGQQLSLGANGTMTWSGGFSAAGAISAGTTITAGGRITSNTDIMSASWIRTKGATGWYNESYGGGMYMESDAAWVRTYAKPLYSGYVRDIGPWGFNVNIKAEDSDNAGIEICGGSYTMGLGCHSNGTWYWWRGTANTDASTNKSYCMEYNGTTWKFYGNIAATGGVSAKATSDVRLKEGFDYGVDYRAKLLSLGPVVDYSYNALGRNRSIAKGDDKRHTGVIWQNAVNAGITGFCSMDEDGFGSVNPVCPDLIFTMLGALQMNTRDLLKLNLCANKHETEIERLKRENEEMKARIDRLENENRERRTAICL